MGRSRAVAMIAEHLQSPDVPAAFVVGQVVVGDGNELARGGGAAGQGEHVDLAIGQQGAGFAAASRAIQGSK